MSDRQIFALNKALTDTADAVAQEADPERLNELGNAMQAGLAEDLQALAKEDPERVKGIVLHCMQSHHAGDGDLAVLVVPGLASHDWAFTRDVLVRLDEDERATRNDRYVGELAASVIHGLLSELDAVQAADLQERLARSRQLRGL